MLRVSFQGLRKEMYLPSGEICAPAISGLPKKSSRSMSGGRPDWAFAGVLAGALLSCAPSTDTDSTRHNSAYSNLFILTSLVRTGTCDDREPGTAQPDDWL